jgi:hypothetical protein
MGWRGQPATQYPQFAPKVIIKPTITTMIDLISAAAEQMKVNVFHRFALMRHWREVNGTRSWRYPNRSW